MGLLSMSCFNRQGEVKADDSKYTGTEPTWDDADKLTEYQLTERMAKGLAFYSYYCTKKDLLKYKLRYSGKVGYVKIPLCDSFQLDSYEDLYLLRRLL